MTDLNARASGPPRDTAGPEGPEDRPGGALRTPKAGVLQRLVGSNRWVALFLAVAALYLFGWGIGSYPLVDPWEPKYAQAMRDMAERGDFITPYFNDKIRWTKPILIYWAMYVPVKLFGNNEFSVRLAPVLAGVSGVLLMFYFLARLRGRRTAIFGACVLMTLPQYFYVAREAVPDMLLNVCLLGAMAFFALARFSEGRRDLHLVLFYASVGLGFLTKGPLAPVLTLFALALFALLDLDPVDLKSLRRLRDLGGHLWSHYRIGRGLVVMTLIAGPWYIVMLITHGGAFIENFLFDENISRFSEPLFDHTGKITHYLNTMFHGMYPWFSFLPAGVPFLFARRRQLDEETRLLWYVLAWFTANFLLFTAAGTKLDHYILPATPAVAVLVALIWEHYFEGQAAYWFRLVLVISMGFMILTVKDFVAEGNRYLMTVFLPAQEIWEGWEAIDLALMIFLVAWIAIISLAWFIPRSRVLVALAILAAFGNGIFFSHIALPRHAPERSLKQYTELFDKVEEKNAELLFYGWIRYSLTYYHGYDYRYFEPDQFPEMVRYVRDRPDVYIIVQEEFLDRVLDDLHVAALTRWTLVSDEHPLFTMISNTRHRRLRMSEAD